MHVHVEIWFHGHLQLLHLRQMLAFSMNWIRDPLGSHLEIYAISISCSWYSSIAKLTGTKHCHELQPVHCLKQKSYTSYLCCILICLPYVSYHISAKKQRGLFRPELASWTRFAVFLYACYMCHIIFLLRNTGDCFAWNWLYEPVLLYSYMLAMWVISYFC